MRSQWDPVNRVLEEADAEAEASPTAASGFVRVEDIHVTLERLEGDGVIPDAESFLRLRDAFQANVDTAGAIVLDEESSGDEGLSGLYAEAQKARLIRQLGPFEGPAITQRLNSIAAGLAQTTQLGEGGVEVFVYPSSQVQAFVYCPEPGEKSAIYSSDQPPSRTVFLSYGLLLKFQAFCEARADKHLDQIIGAISSSCPEAVQDIFAEARSALKAGKDRRQAVQSIIQQLPDRVAHRARHAIEEWDEERIVHEDEVAYVLAHEIRHLVQSRTEEPPSEFVDREVIQKQQEYDADLTGIEKIMAEAGFNPRAAVKIMEFLAEGSSYSLTHPHGLSRLAEVKKFISNPDTPLASLDADPVPLCALPAISTVSERIENDILQAGTLSGLVEAFTEHATDSCSLLVCSLLLRMCISTGWRSESAGNREVQGTLMASLCAVGMRAEKYAAEQREELQEQREELAQLEEQLGMISVQEEVDILEGRMEETRDGIHDTEKTLQKIENGDYSQALQFCRRPGGNTGLQAWRNAAIALDLGNPAVLPEDCGLSRVTGMEKDAGEAHLLSKDWCSIRDAWIEDGSLPEDETGRQIRIALDYFAQKGETAGDVCGRYDTSTPEGRDLLLRHFAYTNLDFADDDETRPSHDLEQELLWRLAEPFLQTVSAEYFESVAGTDRRQQLAGMTLRLLYPALFGEADTDEAAHHLWGTITVDELSALVTAMSFLATDSELVMGDNLEKYLPMDGHLTAYLIRGRRGTELPLEWVERIAVLAQNSPHCSGGIGRESVERAVGRLSQTLPGHKDIWNKLRKLTQESDTFITPYSAPGQIAGLKKGQYLEFWRRAKSQGLDEPSLAGVRRLLVNDRGCGRMEASCILLDAYQEQMFEAGANAEQLREELAAALNSAISTDSTERDFELDQEHLERFLAALSRDGFAPPPESARFFNHDAQEVLNFLFLTTPSSREIEYDAYIQLLRNTASLAHLPLADLIVLLPDRGIFPPVRALAQLYEDGELALSHIAEFRKRLESCVESGMGPITETSELQKGTIEEYLIHICLLSFSLEEKETFPALAGEVSAHCMRQGCPGYQYSVGKVNRHTQGVSPHQNLRLLVSENEGGLREAAKIQEWDRESICRRFPPCDFRDALLTDCLEREGFGRDHMLEALPFFTGDGLITGKDASFAGNLPFIGERRDADSQAQQYQERHEAGHLIPYENLMLFSPWSNNIYGVLCRLYREDSEIFLPAGLPLPQTLAHLCGLVPEGAFRDYLVHTALRRHLVELSGGKLEVSERLNTDFVHPLVHAATLSDPSFINIADTTSYLSAAETRDVMRSQPDKALEALTLASPLFSSQHARENMVREVAQALYPEESHTPVPFAFIQTHLPDASLLRDHLLKQYLLHTSLGPGQIQEAERLFTGEMMRHGDVPKAEFPAAELVRGENDEGLAERRVEYLEWMYGLEDLPPANLRIPGVAFGVHFDNVRTAPFALTSTEHREFLRELTFGPGCLFEPRTPAELEVMTRFLGRFFDKYFGADDEILKMVFLTIFEESRPERRHAIFSALSTACAHETTADPHDLIVIFLETSGAVGTKAGQMLSKVPQVPVELKRKLKRLKSRAVPFSTAGTMRRFKEAGVDGLIKSVDALSGSASMKQGHEVTLVEGRKAMAKAVRPAVDKYNDDDLAVLEKVAEKLEALNNARVRIPPRALSEIKEILDEERDLRIEAERGSLLRKELAHAGRRGGYTFTAPEVIFSSRHVTLETIAKGEELDAVAERAVRNPEAKKLYDRLSREIGLELFRELFHGKVFHADLHDSNIFVESTGREITFIDSGAVGRSHRLFRSLAVALLARDPEAIAEFILPLSREPDNKEVAHLSERILRILQSTRNTEGVATRLSCEILDFIEPSSDLRLFLKALAVGAPHLRRVIPSVKEISAHGFRYYLAHCGRFVALGGINMGALALASRIVGGGSD